MGEECEFKILTRLAESMHRDPPELPVEEKKTRMVVAVTNGPDFTQPEKVHSLISLLFRGLQDWGGEL